MENKEEFRQRAYQKWDSEQKNRRIEMSKDDEARQREAQRKADQDKSDAYNREMRARSDEKNARHQVEKQKTRDAMGGKGCFPKGTKITTPNGTGDISTLREGDFVIAVSPKDGKKQNRRILRKLTHADNKIWLLEFSDGGSVRTTAVHSFSVDGIWKKASEIKSGNSIFSYTSKNGFSKRNVISSRLTNDTEDVYNIIVEGDFNFVADGVLAHSFTYFKNVRKLAWSFYELRLLSRIIENTLRLARKIKA